jgi:hypothetical protein
MEPLLYDKAVLDGNIITISDGSFEQSATLSVRKLRADEISITGGSTDVQQTIDVMQEQINILTKMVNELYYPYRGNHV